MLPNSGRRRKTQPRDKPSGNTSAKGKAQEEDIGYQRNQPYERFGEESLSGSRRQTSANRRTPASYKDQTERANLGAKSTSGSRFDAPAHLNEDEEIRTPNTTVNELRGRLASIPAAGYEVRVSSKVKGDSSSRASTSKKNQSASQPHHTSTREQREPTKLNFGMGYFPPLSDISNRAIINTANPREDLRKTRGISEPAHSKGPITKSRSSTGTYTKHQPPDAQGTITSGVLDSSHGDVANPLQGIDGSKRDTLGEVELIVTIGPTDFNITFQVLDIPTTYNMLLGCPWIHAAGAVPSTLHQKI